MLLFECFTDEKASRWYHAGLLRQVPVYKDEFKRIRVGMLADSRLHSVLGIHWWLRSSPELSAAAEGGRIERASLEQNGLEEIRLAPERPDDLEDALVLFRCKAIAFEISGYAKIVFQTNIGSIPNHNEELDILLVMKPGDVIGITQKCEPGDERYSRDYIFTFNGKAMSFTDGIEEEAQKAKSWSPYR